jgi:hypothetical protein
VQDGSDDDRIAATQMLAADGRISRDGERYKRRSIADIGS